MFGLGITELIILVGLIVLFFGDKKIGELARNVGEAVQILKQSFSDGADKTDKKD